MSECIAQLTMHVSQGAGAKKPILMTLVVQENARTGTGFNLLQDSECCPCVTGVQMRASLGEESAGAKEAQWCVGPSGEQRAMLLLVSLLLVLFRCEHIAPTPAGQSVC